MVGVCRQAISECEHQEEEAGVAVLQTLVDPSQKFILVHCQHLHSGQRRAFSFL